MITYSGGNDIRPVSTRGCGKEDGKRPESKKRMQIHQTRIALEENLQSSTAFSCASIMFLIAIHMMREKVG
ncbi:hypothetical protein [Acetobacter pasteurianus]|uniref:hypothetical protein n=1 Tax=Acetobacter pasteurianus TaxID=438 RepID=UPI00139236B2|nr:hypothetical protein [Acetobacter pasteurianus]